MRGLITSLICLLATATWSERAAAQRIQFPATTPGLRPIDDGGYPGVAGTTMVPINPATQAGIYPSTGYGGTTFDPYAGASGASTGAVPYGVGGAVLAPPVATQGSGYPPASLPTTAPMQTYPNYSGPAPTLPGTGQSAIVGTFPDTASTYSQPGLYPNSAPSALFPGYGGYGGGGYGGGGFSSWFHGLFGGSGYGQTVYPTAPAYPVYPPASGGGYFDPNAGAMPPGNYPQFVRFFQGVRFRHGYLHGNDDVDSLMINDSDLALAFAIPNFLFSTQPLYLLPSFSLHQWAGPSGPTADLPPVAYSAFLDSGWQSDPARILGAELGLRIGVFSDFDTAISDSLRIQGRAIARLRLTPRATLKGGVIYLDRNRVRLLPAAGLLWHPNPDTRFDLFFPEPKLAHYLMTLANTDTWWYVGGYYGGGSWTVERTSGAKESMDINDLRLVLGIEWGRNDQIRDGRRNGFLEVGYVFNRELIYKENPIDNIDLRDTFTIRAGLGF